MSDAIIVSGILGCCGLIITFFYNKKNTKLANHKMHKELFKEFNERYNNLNEDLNLLGEMNLETFNSESLAESKQRIINTIYDFFNLCSEEYYWKRKKRISKRVWRSWDKGMNDIYNRSEVIRYFWDEECKNDGYVSYYIDKKDDFFKLR